MLEKYRNYDVADFVQDEYFRRWVLNPTQEVEEFWSEWAKLHPDKRSLLSDARKLLVVVDFKRTPPAFTAMPAPVR